jgi:hypothetical protein
MYTEVLRAIDGIAVFPVVSLILFVAVFSVALIRTARLDRARLDEFAQLPLEKGRPGVIPGVDR